MWLTIHSLPILKVLLKSHFPGSEILSHVLSLAIEFPLLKSIQTAKTKPQTDWLISNRNRVLSSGGWKSKKIRVPAYLGEGPLPVCRLMVVSSCGGRGQGSSLGFLLYGH